MTSPLNIAILDLSRTSSVADEILIGSSRFCGIDLNRLPGAFLSDCAAPCVTTTNVVATMAATNSEIRRGLRVGLITGPLP
jgi:hypothetical protein